MRFAPRVLPFGGSALLVEVTDVFDESAVAWAREMADHWERVLALGPAVPAYASVLLGFDPERTAPNDAEAAAGAMLARGGGASAPSASRRRTVEIPTRYDGPDLADVAARSGLSVDELVALHSGKTYTAFFLGFLPGFAYCGRLDPRIVAPRLDRPRERVPAGAVAVADGQTAVYPSTSPGGWKLIGTTDLVIFDPEAAEPSRIHAGDHVRFVPL